MSDYNQNNGAMGWDDLFDDSGEFTILPDGDYYFTITKFERAMFNGSEKLPPCNMAVLELTVPYEGNEVKIKYNLILHKTLKFRAYQLFECVGLIKKGSGEVRLPWEQLMGKSGICHIAPREYNNNKYNDVKKCYPVEDAPKVTKNSPAATAPQFSL